MVNYNAAEHLASCLSSLQREGVETVLVVDNASRDDSREVVERTGAGWLQTGGNIGYGRAANLGVASAELAGAQLLLISNPDVVLCDSAVDHLVAAMDGDERLGIVGPRILNPDGTVYPSARTFPNMVDAIGHGLLGMVMPRNRFTRRYRLLDWDHSRPGKVDWVSGACFLVRREVWEEVGGFDPAYFMYMEDVDLCWRARSRGWEVAYEPKAEVVHVQGVSADRHPYRMLAAHHRSMWRFAAATTTGSRRAFLPVVGAGLLARLVAAALWHRFAPASVSRPAEPATGAPRPRPLP